MYLDQVSEDVQFFAKKHIFGMHVYNCITEVAQPSLKSEDAENHQH
jgi:hypothetical protein